eukprot:TRINITY_DN3386_c0_g1_i2.p1 TRINITY_DN3386_c0_g1~~TRINITY_DN3386_c0_g1_i2.p1  ORF type:complete len:426 (-),score=52.61 TRINITY_DN3386_c0_g1_i2:265-1542(-)
MHPSKNPKRSTDDSASSPTTSTSSAEPDDDQLDSEESHFQEEDVDEEPKGKKRPRSPKEKEKVPQVATEKSKSQTEPSDNFIALINPERQLQQAQRGQYHEPQPNQVQSQQTPQQDRNFFAAISQLVQAAQLFERLGERDALRLVLCSKQTCTLLPQIFDHCWIRYHRNRNFQAHKPKRLFIVTPRLDQLLNNQTFSQLSEITFAHFWNYPLPKLPDTITSIKFGHHFDCAISADNLPSSLTYLTLGEGFDHPITSLPCHLTHLKFHKSSRFNHPISANNLPSKLTHLTLGWSFDRPIENLPCQLTHLKFSKISNFTHPVSTANLPSKLTHLQLGRFSQYITSLPPSVQQVTFMDRGYNHRVDHLSKGIRFLTYEKQPYQYSNTFSYDTDQLKKRSKSKKEKAGPVNIDSSLLTSNIGERFFFNS